MVYDIPSATSPKASQSTEQRGLPAATGSHHLKVKMRTPHQSDVTSAIYVADCTTRYKTWNTSRWSLSFNSILKSVIRIFPPLGVNNVKSQISRTMPGSDCICDPLELRTEGLPLLKEMLIPSMLSRWGDREDSFSPNRSSNSPVV